MRKDFNAEKLRSVDTACITPHLILTPEATSQGGQGNIHFGYEKYDCQASLPKEYEWTGDNEMHMFRLDACKVHRLLIQPLHYEAHAAG